MTARSSLPWQQERWARVTAALDAGRLAHALLLAGPRGVGKGRFALALAQFLLCEGAAGKPCGACRSCQQLAAGSHPNALLLSTEGLHCATLDPARREGAIPLWQPDKDSRKRDIAVDAIRELIARLGIASHYGQARIVIVNPADTLNAAGANALLKTIEEPPPGTYVVLVAERWRALPATLRSRCQIQRFAPPPAAQALAWLKARHPQQPEAALRALTRTPLLADERLEAEATAAREAWGRALAELLEGRVQPLKLASGIKREQAQAALEQWLALATEALTAALVPGRAGARPIPKGARPEVLQRFLDEAIEGLRMLDRNASPALLMESIMIRLSEHAASGR